MNLLLVFALPQAAPTGGGVNMPALLFQLAAFIAIFWFILIRPQQRERKQLESAIMELKRGDEVVTQGGIIAEVVHIQLQPAAEGKEPAPGMTDRITVRSAESKFVVERGRIARVSPKST